MEKKIELKLLLYCFTITPHPSICSKKFYFFKFLKDDLDYDQEFKIKCEANLKLSKKLKTKSAKHQKKLMESLEVIDGGGSTTSATARTTDPTSKSLNSLNVDQRSSVNIMGFNSPEWAISFMGSILHNNVFSGVYITNSD